MNRSLSSVLSELPDAWPESLLPTLRERVRQSGETVVVLDDDPTGTQTVYDTPVLTEWSVPVLKQELEEGPPLVYILTNSRSLTATSASRLAGAVGENLCRAAELTRRPVRVISRSDSTLRGHYPSEVDALAAAVGMADAPRCLVPFFEEGGRYTIADVHYVLQEDQLIPAAETAFARDPAFGYRHSDLRDWVEEKTGGAIRAADVRSIPIEAIRSGGPAAVAERLRRLTAREVCVVNAASFRDLEVFVAGLLDAEASGGTFVARTAASFVRARAGMEKRPLLTAAELEGKGQTDCGGLIVVGSFVPQSTEQLARLLRERDVWAIEISVANLLRGTRAAELEGARQKVEQKLRRGDDVALFTSRDLVRAGSLEENVAIGQSVSEALVQIVENLSCTPRFLVAKGGITSSDLATRALGVRRAMVRGQVLAGVPVWELGAESRMPGMNYVVFPGNVGGPEALVSVFNKLSPTRNHVRNAAASNEE